MRNVLIAKKSQKCGDTFDFFGKNSNPYLENNHNNEVVHINYLTLHTFITYMDVLDMKILHL